MAEDSGGGGGRGTITLPKIGPVKKKPFFIVTGAAAAFVVWRYWQSSRAGETVEGDSDGDGFADAGTIPAVEGAGGPATGYTVRDGERQESTTDSYGFTGTTNSQWTQYAATQLSASDRWSYTDIVEALGAYLANRPLTGLQQSIVQAAKGVAGEPPVGSHVIVPGGDTPITVAPGTPTATAGTTTVRLSWPAVAGAASYRVYQGGVGENVGTSVDTVKEVGGLRPNTPYKFQVAAVTAAGKVGPKSSPVSVTTKAATLKAPTGVKVSGVTRTTARVSWGAVAGAEGYKVYVNDIPRGHSDKSPYTVVGLKAGTSYKVHVRADTPTQGPGPASGKVSFKTKK